MCKKVIYLAVVLSTLAISVPVQAGVFRDDFETPRDYLTETLEGTGWDGFTGLGLNETADALNASIDRPGELYLESVESFWWPPFTTLGPFLYKEVEGDFIATVQVKEYADVAYNNIGLMARVGDPDLAGSGEDWVSIDYFPIYSVGNIARYCNDNSRTEDGGGNGTAWDAPTYLRLTREGNTFRLWTSLDGSVWVEYPDPAFSPLERPDLDGLPLQVGLHHATGTGNTGFGAFDSFSIEGPSVAPPGEAYNPNPAEVAVDVPRDSDLIWTPAATAVAHDVYFGTDLNNVSDASRTNPLSVMASQGQNAATYDPPGLLEFGQTYYWRVDEVEADGTLLTGSIWSFTAEPFAYPIDGANITATASSSMAGSSPQKTVDGSGLNDSDLHSINLADTWLSDLSGTQPTWIEYQFDKAYKLHEMWVWNQNQVIEPSIGYGFKDVTIEYSVDGIDYATLGTTHEFARAPAPPGAYAHNTTVDLGGAMAKYVRLTANSNWGGILAQYGLSEVRFFSIPVLARKPSPASGATDVGVDVTLNWRTGREADKHDVYLSTDEQAVIDGTAPVVTVAEASYSTSLDMDSTYYWRIDEVNDAETPTTWQGDIWSLSTLECFVVDDFESYNEIAAGEEGSNLVYDTWIDGFANPSVNGSTMGHTVPFEPSMETSIVYDGEQSAPLYYDNSTASYSEATANVADLQVGRDWTKGAPETLVLWIHGALSNAAADQLYVKINSTKVMYGGDLSVPIWKQWNVDLASLGMNLSNITTLSIGVDGSGSGMLYVDGIALYRIAPPVLERAVVFSDDFETAHDYVADGVDGTGWDGFLGLSPGETVDALNASIDRAGQLYLASTNARWNAPWDPLGPYLYKIIEGDFIATVQVVDYAGTEAAVVYHNDGGLSARVPNPADAGDGEDWVAIQYFPIWNCGNFVRTANDNSRTENGNNGMAFGLDPWLQLERVGNTFHFRTSVDGLSWTEMSVSPITRDDMAGLPLQVGIHHATYSENPGYIAFDNFSIESPFSVGPVGHWKLDEASGLTAADSSGYGNDGTLMNMAGTEWTAGILDGALRLDGNGQYVDFGNPKSLQLTGEVTISAWAKMEPANEDVYQGIAGKLAGGNNGYALVRHSSNVFRMWVGNIEGSALEGVSSDVTYNDTDWHHLVGVVSNNTGYLYVDGVKQAEEAAVRLVESGDYAYIGRQYSDYDDRYWNGTIDDVRIYYRALSAQEVLGL